MRLWTDPMYRTHFWVVGYMLNTELVDVTSGRPRFTTLTRASYILGKDNVITDVASRRTKIVSEHGCTVAEIQWTGREKKSGGLIRILDSGPIKLSELFGGCESIDASSGSLSIPTRIGFHWIATRYSLIVCNSDTKDVAMKYHEKCVHVGNNLSPSPIPKIGNDFLELEELPDAIIAELLVGFMFVNIMRRTRFNLPLYQFPLVDNSDGERHSVSEALSNVKESLGIFRRNTL